MCFEAKLEGLCTSIVRLASDKGLTVSTAESCTAGMVASAIAGIPGASAVLRGGAVTYCDEVKHRVLGVSNDTLATCTAVSFETARDMAAGSRELFQSDVAVSLTGYAGPGGGTERDPAGTVYIGTSDSFETKSERHLFSGSRNEVRAKATARALEIVLERLEIL